MHAIRHSGGIHKNALFRGRSTFVAMVTTVAFIQKRRKKSLFFVFRVFFATFLYENETPGLEQATVITMATRVLQPLKRAFCVYPLSA